MRCRPRRRPSPPNLNEGRFPREPRSPPQIMHCDQHQWYASTKGRTRQPTDSADESMFAKPTPLTSSTMCETWPVSGADPSLRSFQT